ncbi:prolyl oligopeptidase family serine peptidase [Paenibacillus chitinolyticus]|uniref:alpha/beta hydrolase family protein n=1 Tax=Paenibacillus chitinolyticus TaxID=79263 RepID=UPI002DBF2E54|nr:prolyl oligopeptidase family serine peptidase [Paenibacillus chitinolyticus]MEC0247533.1 prolyl oligopeptidase family serine peptidase [Paenibacillus chitinolyticus]
MSESIQSGKKISTLSPVTLSPAVRAAGNEAGSLKDGQLLERELLSRHARNVSLYVVTYAAQGLRVKGYLAVPDHAEPLPAVVYCRGGIRRVGMVRIRRIVSMARRGYVVFAPFYRGNEGGEGREDFAGEDRYDVYHGLLMLRDLPEVASVPVSLIGFSRGALMALLAARDCEEVGPVVVWGGVSDLHDTYEERVDLRRMLKRVVGHPLKQADEYIRRSPARWADLIESPVLIVHGTADPQVKISHAYKLAAALEHAGKDHTMLIYEGLEHRFPKEMDEAALDEVFRWMEQKRIEIEGKKSKKEGK